MTGKDATLHDIYQKCILFRLNAKTNNYLSQLNACKRENNEHQGILAYLSCLLVLVILLASAVGHCEESLNIYNYLWDDDNYPCIARFNTAAWHLDKTSVYVEMEEPPQYILHVHVLRTPQLHYNDILPERTESYRILFDEDKCAMYMWLPQKEEWHYLSLDKKNNGDAACVPLYAGEAAFYLTYGERFYDVAPLWFHRQNPWFKKHDEEFYNRLDGAEP